RVSTSYLPADTSSWLISLFDPSKPATHTSINYSPYDSVTRTVAVTSDPVHGGIATLEIEPSGPSSTHPQRTLTRAPQGRLTQVDDQEVLTGTTRTTQYHYDDADGVYVSSVINALGQPTRIYTHPGLGMVVETDDPNNLAATTSYDTFARPLIE